MAFYQGLIYTVTVCLGKRKESSKKEIAFIFPKRCPFTFFYFPDVSVHVPYLSKVLAILFSFVEWIDLWNFNEQMTMIFASGC